MNYNTASVGSYRSELLLLSGRMGYASVALDYMYSRVTCLFVLRAMARSAAGYRIYDNKYFYRSFLGL